MIIGIDLGTTNSLVSVFRDGQPRLVPNVIGHVLTPSVVSLADDGSMLTGLAARERLATHPQRTVSNFKRWMGSDHEVALGNRHFRAEELSAFILGALKADAEAWLQEPVTEAVITVPAYFNDVQRKATQTAGRLAGLNVERLLNEPTAAGLAYGLQERKDHSTFLVFDLGGGTFDVSVLGYFEGIVEVRASAGDTRLGGEDFVQTLLEQFLHETDISDTDRQMAFANKLFWRSVEQAKRDLSEKDSTEITLRIGDHDITHTIERGKYEEYCVPLLQRLRRPIERALMDARLRPEELDEVVLIGGATRMPMVRQLVTRLFGRLPLRTINPDETVARGAAIQAALKARDAALDEVVLTDVMPYSLGIVSSEEVNGQRYFDRFSPILERNTPVPVSRMKVFATLEDGQKTILLDIRQGESPTASENLQLGTLEVSVPPRKKGEAEVEVRFTYDANGLLEVEAHVPLTEKTVSSLIHRDSQVMDETSIAHALEKMKSLKIHPRDQQENAWLVQRAKRLYEDHLGHVREIIGHELTRFEVALDTQDERVVRDARADFKSFLDNIDRGFVL
ncbi:MAG: molecular chaperone HscC [Methylobacillus sp.]|jgi:molecular chaperone HscC|nr:molecular chaperone HscC [Methylobacillus sp.]